MSIRAILVLVTIFCAWLGKISADARRQNKAVLWVGEHLGSVRYDWQLDGQTEPSGPRWLRRCFGNDYFQTPKQVWINDVELKDLAPLTEFSELERLTLIGTDLQDVSALAQLTKLKRLDLSYNDIEDITPLLTLRELEYLELYRNPVARQRSQAFAIGAANRVTDVQRRIIRANMQIRPLFR